jgi:phosphatidylserine synthase
VESIAELRRICQADKLQRSRGLTRLNRFVSIYATFVALALGVPANLLTVASIGAGVLGAVLLALSGYPAHLGGVALLYVSFLLDQVDGEVARYHRTTLAGAYLDEIRHIVIYAAPIFAVSLQLLMARPSLPLAGAGFTAAIGLIILRFNTNAHYLLFAKKVLPASGAAADRGVPPPAAAAPARPRATSMAAPAAGVVKRGIGQVLPAVTYVTTNQVSLLFLLLAYVHVVRFVPSHTLHEGIFFTFAGTVALLTLLSIWKMAYRNRIEKDCAALDRAVGARVG